MADMLQSESKDENPQQQDADQTDKHQSAAARRYSSDEVADIICFSLLDESGKPEEATKYCSL
jgi:hypothetical protein